MKINIRTNHRVLYFIFSFSLLLTERFLSAAPQNVAALAKGGSIYATGNDISSTLYNPAGLGLIFYKEITGNYNNLYFSGFQSGNIGFSTPFKELLNLGFHYNFNFFQDDELSYQNHHGTIAISRKVINELYFGASYNINVISSTLDDEDNESKFSSLLNFGVVQRGIPLNLKGNVKKTLAPLSFGLYFNKLNFKKSIKIDHQNNLTTAIGYGPIKNITTEISFDRYAFRGGFDFLITKQTFNKSLKKTSSFVDEEDKLFSLRGGLVSYQDSVNNKEWSTGIGLFLNNITIDYAMVISGVLPIPSATHSINHYFGLSFKFGFEDSFIRQEEFSLQNIFAALYKSYEKKSFGFIRLKNSSTKPVAIDLSLKVKDYMSAPNVQKISLRPKESQLIPLYATFDNKTSSVTSDQILAAEVEVEYLYNQKKIKKKYTKNFSILDRNALDWSDSQQAATFITPNDPLVTEFARKALLIPTESREGSIPTYMVKAILLFNALQAHGVKYIKDANSSFSRGSSSKNYIDSIQFPAQLLISRGGDCDDSAVLYCSLLENVGIETALIDIPGHIYMMFNTGVTAENGALVSPDEKDYIILDNEVWIAIETTLIDKGFISAWEEGMLEYNRHTERSTSK